MTLLNHVRRHQVRLWAQPMSLPFESAFGRLQKFAWANVMDCQQMGRELFSKRGLPAQPNSWELFRGAWIKTAPKLPPQFELDGGFKSAYGQWMDRLCQREFLRYCPKCLHRGFHSLLYQIEAMTHCPIHEIPFSRECYRCHVKVPLALSKEVFQRPFCCPRCQQPLTGEVDPTGWLSTPEFVGQLTAALKPLSEWLLDLEKFSTVGRYSPLAQLAYAGEFQGELDTVVNSSVAQKFVPLPPSLHKDWLSSRRPLLIEHLVTTETDVLEVTQFEVLEKKAHQFQELQARLYETILKGHFNCIQRARQGVWLRRDFVQVTEQEPGLCPIAAGFERWSKRALAEAEHDRKAPLQFIETNMKYLKASSPQRQLAHFYSSVATAYVFELLYRAGHRLDSAMRFPLRELLERYSFGDSDFDAFWEVVGPKNGERGCRWIVMGDPTILELLGNLHAGKDHVPKTRRRPNGRSKARTG